MTTFETLTNGTLVAINKTVRFGRDAILLAGFAFPRAGGRLLDLGAGCGILALSLIDSGFSGDITALDIDAGACHLARLGAARSGSQNMTVLQADMRAFTARKKFDTIVCNPPYFAPGSGSISTGAYAKKARHQSDAALKDFAAAAARNLKQGGAFVLCFPAGQLAALFDTLRRHRLEPKQLQLVRRAPDAEPWLALIEARLDGGVGLIILPDLLDTA